MDIKLQPFNLDLLIPSESDVSNIRPIKVLDIFTGQSKNFHPEGMFSTEIFGKVGEEKRNRLFSYIDLRMKVFHPTLFNALIELKALYGDILQGKKYAVFDNSIKDFVEVDIIKGKTGFAFFVSHFHELKFEERPSPKREFNIKLINKYKEKALIDKFVVLPAGLRDYVIDENGKPSEDEINPLYRKILSISLITNNISKSSLDDLDTSRYNLQIAIANIYEYILNLLQGKNKLILGKWAARKVYNSTRNVITSYIPDTSQLLGPRTISVNQTAVGMYQYLRAILPLAIQKIRDTYLSKVFLGPNSPAILVNKKTLKKEAVSIDPKHFDEWMTYEGLEKILAKYGEEHFRHDYLEVEGYYIGLLYLGDDKTYKFIQDIDELPENRKTDIEKHVRPITYTELFYMSICKDSKDMPCFVTRYPITGYGSIYPSYVYLKTTVKSEFRLELDDNWELVNNNGIEFPIYGEAFFNSLSPSASHLKRLTADFDRRH